MLRQDFLEVLGIPRARIRIATFLSIRREAPEEAVELSSGSVLGWVQEDEHLFIAADSGINGAESAQGLFAGCISLTEVHVEGWNPCAATDMEGMFRGCVSLERLDIGSWQADNVQTLKGMFEGCTGLRQLKFGSWELPAARDMEAMFKDCASLAGIDGFPLDHAAIDATTFTGCDLLPR